MSAQVFDGIGIAQTILDKIRLQVQNIASQGLRVPGLVIIQVGNDPASDIYIHNKILACNQIGIKSIHEKLDKNISQVELLKYIEKYNEASKVDGILVQLPLPEHINPIAVSTRIQCNKDVDGLHPYNIGSLALRTPTLRPATPKGIMHLLKYTGALYQGMQATVVGASNHVGRPMTLELLLFGCSVTTLHRFSNQIENHIRNADILVSATGKRGLISGSWIKPGAIVIDVGINKDATTGHVYGDVEFQEARARASWITPVPGGVGPMTIAALLDNIMIATCSSRRVTLKHNYTAF